MRGAGVAETGVVLGVDEDLAKSFGATPATATKPSSLAKKFFRDGSLLTKGRGEIKIAAEGRARTLGCKLKFPPGNLLS